MPTGTDLSDYIHEGPTAVVNRWLEFGETKAAFSASNRFFDLKEVNRLTQKHIRAIISLQRQLILPIVETNDVFGTQG